MEDQRMSRTDSEEISHVPDRELFRFLDCAVLYLDRRGHIVQMNPFAERFFGTDAGAFIGMPFFGGLAPERSTTGKNQSVLFEDFLRDPCKSGHFECNVRASDGDMKPMTWTATVHFDARGDIAEIVCIGIDRRAYMERERNMQCQYGLLESFLEASSVSAFAVDSEHRFIYVSPGIQNMLGYSPEEMVGRRPDVFINSEERSRISDLMRDQIRRQNRKMRLVSQSRHKNGAPVWSEVTETLSYNENGEFTGLNGLHWNIDEQKRAELALSEREREFRFCLEHAQVLLIVTDAEGVIRSVNRVGAQMYGREPEEMVGHVFTEFLPDFERERVLLLFKRDFQAAVSKTDSRTVGMGGAVNKIRTPDGLKDILFFKTGVKVYKEGKFEGILNTAVDITEIVKAREELKRHQNHLEQLVAERTAELQSLQEEKVRRERLTALGKMADVVSQEIRTPLSTISNSLFVINERLKNTEIGVRRAIERANRAIRRCYSIVDEFIDLTQTDVLRKKTTDIDAWLDALLNELQETKGATLARQLDSGVSIEIDPDRVRRAVMNILENARHAVQDDPEGRIAVRSELAFNRLEIEISDTGVGIAREDLEQIFEPLFSTKSFGIGLGLAICKQIMEQHGGGISIESEEKKGTRVLLWFPVIL